MTDLKWQKPPDDRRRGSRDGGEARTAAIADALRERPNEWALVYEPGSTSLSYVIKHGKSPAFRPAGSFESVSRRREDGKHDIYARFVGEQP